MPEPRDRSTVLVVEDEPLARRRLSELLSAFAWLECVGEARDGAEAVRLIDQLRPELVFLDVQLPELSGFEVLERIHHDPLVVFSTAFDRYAVAAFEKEALDYLVKPFGAQRLAATLERVRERLRVEPPEPAPAERRQVASGGRSLRRLFVRRGARIVPLPIAAVTRIEAAEGGATVHAGAELFHLPRTLAELEQRLDPERFLRVHRTHIVNLDQVAQMEFEDRHLVLTLRDGTRLTASRAASRRLRERID